MDVSTCPPDAARVAADPHGARLRARRQQRRRRRTVAALGTGAVALVASGSLLASSALVVAGALVVGVLALYLVQVRRVHLRALEPGHRADLARGWSADDLAAWLARTVGEGTSGGGETLSGATAGRDRQRLMDRWTWTQVLWAGIAGSLYNGLLAVAGRLAAGTSMGWLRRRLLVATTALIACLGRRSVRMVTVSALAAVSSTGVVATVAGAATPSAPNGQPVAAHAVLTDAVAATTTYTVVPGDTLSSIAARFSTTVAAIATANDIADPNLIYAGQVFTIPASTPGVAAATPPTPAASTPLPAAATTTYTVVPGDTLSSIAARFSTTVAAIATANDIADPNLIYAGQVFTIPSGGPLASSVTPTPAPATLSAAVPSPAAPTPTPAAPTPTPAATTPPPAAGTSTYTVVPGDTLSSIAARFSTTVAAIATANGIADPNVIYAGQVLTIPTGVTTVSAVTPPASAPAASAPAPSAPAPSAPAPSGVAGYANPLRAVRGLVPERIDEGVDFSGSGPVYALGDGVVLNTANAGWPGGAFISYELTNGPAEGDIVYAAEGLVPRVQVGQQITPTTVIGTLLGGTPGLETGWAAQPGNGNAAASGQWDGATSTAYGLNFSQLLAALGAPSGVLEGAARGSLPAGWPSW